MVTMTKMPPWNEHHYVMNISCVVSFTSSHHTTMTDYFRCFSAERNLRSEFSDLLRRCSQGVVQLGLEPRSV